MKRLQSRHHNGRFTRNTTENCFGLHVGLCPNPECRGFIPYDVGEKRPEVCPRCGTLLTKDDEPATFLCHNPDDCLYQFDGHGGRLPGVRTLCLRVLRGCVYAKSSPPTKDKEALPDAQV